MDKVKHEVNLVSADDTYHNRFAPDRKHNKNSKKFKPLKKKCSKCGTTSGQLDIHHKNGNREDNSRSNLTYMCRSCHRSKHDGNGHIENITSTAARIIKDPHSTLSEKIAQAHENEDLMYVEFILCHSNVNQNKDGFSSEDLLANSHTAINKPINWEHSTKNIGVIFDSKPISISKMSDQDKEYYGKIDPLEYDFTVCQAAIWEYKHPEEASIMRSRNDSDLLFFSMENKFGAARCSECQEVFSSVYDYCDHLLSRRASNAKSHREFIDSNFIGAAVVARPADKGAKTLAVAKDENKPKIHEFSSLIDISDYVDYAIGGEVNMRTGIEIDSEYECQGEIDNIFYADDVNKHFPINKENINETANILLSENHEALENYTKAEHIYMIERLVQSAKEYDINLNEFVKGEDKTVANKEIIDTLEFKKAVEEAVAQETTKLKNGQKLTELETSNKDSIARIEALEAKIAEEAKAKQEAEDNLEAYKAATENEKIARSRLSKLEEEGFSFGDDSKGIIFSCAANLNNDNYASFVDVLREVRDNAIEASKTKETKEDIVTASNKSISFASIDDGDNNSFGSRIDYVFNAIGEEHFPATAKLKEGK